VVMWENGGWIGDKSAERVRSGAVFRVQSALMASASSASQARSGAREKQTDHSADALLLVRGRTAFEGRVDRRGGEELLTIDQSEKGHGLDGERRTTWPEFNDGPCFPLDEATRGAVCQQRRAEKDFEAVVVESHAKTVADQGAKAKRIKHLREG